MWRSYRLIYAHMNSSGYFALFVETNRSLLVKSILLRIDIAKFGLEFVQIFTQCMVKKLGVHRCQNDSGMYLGFGHIR